MDEEKTKEEKTKEQEKAEAKKAKAESKIEVEEAAIFEEAETLGIKPPKVSGAKMKSESARRKDTINHLKLMIATKKEMMGLKPAQARDRLLKARLSNPSHQYPREQVQQFRLERLAIKEGKWQPPKIVDGRVIPWRVPKKKTEYERIMEMD